MAARVSGTSAGRNLCYAEAVRIVGRNVYRWIFRTQAATPYRSEERVVAGNVFSPLFSPRCKLFSHERAGAHTHAPRAAMVGTHRSLGHRASKSSKDPNDECADRCK